MLVVLLTHPGDRQLAVQLCDHIRFLGGVSNHECLIVSPVGTVMDGIEDVLRSCFGSVWSHQYNATMKGWPFGPNEAAAIAMIHVWTTPALRYHYLMLESDCVPSNPRWLDLIDTEYRRMNAPILGVRIDTKEIATGNVVGKHTIGVAVYPKLFPQICPLVKSLVNMTQGYRQQGAMPMPWDAYFGPYTARMTADTTLIQHLARQANQTPNGLQWDCPNLAHAISQVRNDAVLIHGSKDPAFLPAITGRINHAPLREVPRHSEEKHPVAPASEARKGEEPARETNGDHPPKELTPKLSPKEEKRRLKKHNDDMRMRQENGWEAMPATPQWDRTIYFNEKMPWPKFRAYASQLGAQGFGKGNTKGSIINRVIAIEKEQGVEKWTKLLLKSQGELDSSAPHKPAPAGSIPAPAIPVEDAPPIAPGSLPTSNASNTTNAWKPVDETGRLIDPNPQPDSGGKFSPQMQAKMLALRNNRASMLAGAPSAA